MNVIRARAMAAAVAACTCFALVACASQAASVGDGSSAGTASPGPANPQADSTAEARALVADFTPPPSAHRSAQRPSGAPTEMDDGVPQDSAEAVAWWTVDEPAATALAWVQAHVSATLGKGGRFSATLSHGAVSFAGYAYFPTADAQNDARSLSVGVAALPGGGTAISATAYVEYPPPPRPAADKLPAAGYLAITPLPPLGPSGARSSVPDVVVTDPATISRIEGFINALALIRPGVRFNCGLDDGSGLRLVFRASAGSPVLAQVNLSEHGCEDASQTIGGVQEPGMTGGQQAIDQISSLLGDYWFEPAPHATGSAGTLG